MNAPTCRPELNKAIARYPDHVDAVMAGWYAYAEEQKVHDALLAEITEKLKDPEFREALAKGKYPK
jgi:mannitol/fructose-specific phosphotransferase system IIA component (Ntr-type)